MDMRPFVAFAHPFPADVLNANAQLDEVAQWVTSPETVGTPAPAAAGIRVIRRRTAGAASASQRFDTA